MIINFIRTLPTFIRTCTDEQAARIGDGASLMREQLEDGRYRKTWKKMMEPEYEFHPEPDVQTAG